MHISRLFSPRRVVVLVGMAMGWLTFACGPAVVATPTAVPADPFSVVRATSQAAYASGQAHLDRGELQQALIDLDTARTNDPDTRADIEQALSQTISQLALLTPTPEPTRVPRAIIVGTLPAARPDNAITPRPGTPAPSGASAPAPATTAPPTSAARSGQTPLATAGPTSAAAAGSTAPGATSQAAGPAALVAFRDPQGRFTLSTPGDWARSAQPLSLFGTSVVQFHDPSAQAELDVAVDGSTRAVSPELYAATIELAMQQQVPGYAAEQTQPGSTSGSPSVRRVYTYTQRDAAGNDNQARGFQVAVVKGSTPYLISGSARADRFEAFSATFDQMLETFQFS